MDFVRLSSNKSSARAFPNVSITLLYYRNSTIIQVGSAYLYQVILVNTL